MVVTLIAMTPNRAMPRTISIAAMRSEGAIGPARDASSRWNWALTDFDIANSFLAPTQEPVRGTIRDEASLPNARSALGQPRRDGFRGGLHGMRQLDRLCAIELAGDAD